VRGPCPGLYAGYREVHGDGEVKAVTGRARSNSFTYEHEAVHGRLPAGGTASACPVRTGGVTPWDRGRILFLREGERVERYRTGSRDFTDVEIAHTKLQLGQVYDDVSPDKPAPDDFARDLGALHRSPVCDPCPERDRCGGLWERASEAPGDDVFTRDDARVRDAVRALRGDVLDVGCGEGRYHDVIAEGAAQGLLRWVGLEPEIARAEALRAAASWAQVRVGQAEDVTDEARFDHVLVLRSWNHLHDPSRAAAALVRALRPGGTLLVVDNLAFGLLRRRAPVDVRAGVAGVAGAAWEHHRNDDAGRAHALLSALPVELALELVERVDVVPGSSNQWLLRYRRT